MMERWRAWVLGFMLSMLTVWTCVALVVQEWGGVKIGVPPLLMLYGCLLIPVCLWIMAYDRWAGWIGLYCLARAFPFPPLTLETVIAIVAGLSVYTLAKNTSEKQSRVVVTVIQAAGAFTAAAAIWEVVMSHIIRWTPIGIGLGNTNYTGAFMAISAGLAPTVMLPLWVLGVAASKSMVSGLALGTMLVVRFRRHWWSIPIAIASIGMLVAYRGSGLLTASYRLNTWGWLLSQWLHAPAFGYGPGGWIRTGLVVSMSGRMPEWMAQAHNDYLQFLFDFGLVGILLIGAWVVSHRKSFCGYFGPAVAAIAVQSLGTFPFQIPAVACLALLVLGLATREVTCEKTLVSRGRLPHPDVRSGSHI